MKRVMSNSGRVRRSLVIPSLLRNETSSAEDDHDTIARVTSFLKAERQSTAGSPPLPTDVVLEVGDNMPRTTILSKIQKLYDVCSTVDMTVDVDIIPVIKLGSEGAADGEDSQLATEGLQHFTREHLLQAEGFKPNYGYVAMGGTFDRLHSGHKMLLTSSALHAVNKLRIGVTGPELLKNKKFGEMLQPYEVREGRALEFVSKLREDLELEPAVLVEASGGTDSIPDVEALVVSPETKGAVDVINVKRKENGLRPMEGVSIEYVGGSDENSRVSSTKLRELAQRSQETDGHTTR